MTKRLQSVDEVIAELGGQKAVAELVRCRAPNTVPMWKNRKKFPAATFKVMQCALQERGATAPSDLWGMA